MTPRTELEAFNRLEYEATAQIKDNHREQMELYVDAFDLFLRCCRALEGIKLMVEQQTVIALSTTAAITGKCVFDLAVRGYTTQAQMMSRPHVEGLVFAEYYRHFPDKAKRWTYSHRHRVDVSDAVKELKDLNPPLNPRSVETLGVSLRLIGRASDYLHMGSSVAGHLFEEPNLRFPLPSYGPKKVIETLFQFLLDTTVSLTRLLIWTFPTELQQHPGLMSEFHRMEQYSVKLNPIA
jgi:hypothetical protein